MVDFFFLLLNVLLGIIRLSCIRPEISAFQSSIYQSISRSSDNIWAKHHPRSTHEKTVFSARLHKLSMAISKHLHNIPKIDWASKFTCSSKLAELLKPCAVLRLHKVLLVHRISQLRSTSFQRSQGQHLTKRDRWTEAKSACHQSLQQPS